MSVNKLSGYQKLKAENLKLKQDSSTLATKPYSKEGLLIKAEWVMLTKQEDALWMGSNEMPEVFQGLLSQIDNAST